MRSSISIFVTGSPLMLAAITWATAGPKEGARHPASVAIARMSADLGLASRKGDNFPD